MIRWYRLQLRISSEFCIYARISVYTFTVPNILQCATIAIVERQNSGYRIKGTQDTNAIQEKIFFNLAKGNQNICVVGDDDQALYRFRGATVENLVEFEDRCLNAIGVKPKRIDLDINYRSRKNIVDTYTGFINLADWQKERPLTGHYLRGRIYALGG